MRGCSAPTPPDLCSRPHHSRFHFSHSGSQSPSKRLRSDAICLPPHSPSSASGLLPHVPSPLLSLPPHTYCPDGLAILPPGLCPCHLDLPLDLWSQVSAHPRITFEHAHYWPSAFRGPCTTHFQPQTYHASTTFHHHTYTTCWLVQLEIVFPSCCTVSATKHVCFGYCWIVILCPELCQVHINSCWRLNRRFCCC